VLTPGQTYHFELRAACGAEGFGRALVSVAVASPPSSGTFSVAPRAGVAGQTLFTLRCARWEAEAEDLPLSYLYSLLRADNASAPLAPRLIDAELAVTLPEDPRALTPLQVLVCDASFACSEPAADAVAVAPPPGSFSAAAALEAWVCAAPETRAPPPP